MRHTKAHYLLDRELALPVRLARNRLGHVNLLFIVGLGFLTKRIVASVVSSATSAKLWLSQYAATAWSVCNRGMRSLSISSASTLQPPADIPPVLNPQDLHRLRLVVNVIKRPDATNPYPPCPRAELYAPFGSGHTDQRQQGAPHPHHAFPHREKSKDSREPQQEGIILEMDSGVWVREGRGMVPQLHKEVRSGRKHKDCATKDGGLIESVSIQR